MKIPFFFSFYPHILLQFGASLVAQRLKRLPAMRETWVRSLGREDPLEKEIATHSSVLVWRIPWMEEPGELQSTGHKESDMTERLHFHFSSFNLSVWFTSVQFSSVAQSCPTFCNPMNLSTQHSEN